MKKILDAISSLLYSDAIVCFIHEYWATILTSAVTAAIVYLLLR